MAAESSVRYWWEAGQTVVRSGGLQEFEDHLCVSV